MEQAQRIPLVLLATGLSTAGSQMTLVAVPLLLVEHSHADRLPAAVAIELAVAGVGGLYIARATSRLRAPARLIVIDAVRCVFQLLLLLVDPKLDSIVSVPLLLTVVAVFAPAYAGGFRAVLAATVSGASDREAAAFGARAQLINRGAQLSGFAIAGVLVAIGVRSGLVLIDAVSYLFAASIMWTATRSSRDSAGPLPQLIGFKRSMSLGHALFPIAATEGVLQGLFVLLPLVLGRQHDGPWIFAGWMSALAVGNALGVRFLSRKHLTPPTPRVLLLLIAGSYAASGIGHSPILQFVALTIIGVASAVYAAITFACVSRELNPDDLGAAYAASYVVTMLVGAATSAGIGLYPNTRDLFGLSVLLGLMIAAIGITTSSPDATRAFVGPERG